MSTCDEQAGHFAKKALESQTGRVAGSGTSYVWRKEIFGKKRGIGHYVIELLVRA
mgnify:FL=1